MATFINTVFLTVIAHDTVVHQMEQMVSILVGFYDVMRKACKKRPCVCWRGRHCKDPFLHRNERYGELVPGVMFMYKYIF